MGVYELERGLLSVRKVSEKVTVKRSVWSAAASSGNWRGLLDAGAAAVRTRG